MPEVSTGQMLVLACAGSSLAAMAVGIAMFVTARGRRHVRSFSPYTPVEQVPEHIGFDITRDRFSKRKIPESIDVIIIGSGISGLYCAALLAKAGKRVLVLEQHFVAGGCTHSFEDRGWEFDTGVHYVGRIDKYGHLLDMVSEGPNVQWQQLGTEANGYVYDEIKLGDAPTHKLRAGHDAFLTDLIGRFPAEENGLREYLNMVAECNNKSELHFFGKLFPVWMERLLEWTVGARFQELSSQTLQQVLDKLFTTPTLKALLSSQFGDYGLPPDEASFFIHAGVVAHYLEGAYYPIGGPQSISRALIPTICRAGGRVLVNAPVKYILTSAAGRAYGVEIDGNKTQIFAPVIISAAGAYATELMVESTTIMSPSVRALMGGISHVYAFIGIDGDSEKLSLPASNIWALPGEDINAERRDYYSNPFWNDPKKKQMMFIGFPSAKDPSFAIKHPKKSTCVIITEAKAEWFDEFRETDTGKRTKEYEALKLRFKNKLLTGLYDLFPQLDGRIRYCELATPLTNYFYLRRVASYGLSHPPSRYTSSGSLRPQTDLPGLWLTGQDVTTCGFAGAMMGGLLTAHGVLGYSWFDLLLCGTNLVTDMEKSKQIK